MKNFEIIVRRYRASGRGPGSGGGRRLRIDLLARNGPQHARDHHPVIRL